MHFEKVKKENLENWKKEEKTTARIRGVYMPKTSEGEDGLLYLAYLYLNGKEVPAEHCGLFTKSICKLGDELEVYYKEKPEEFRPKYSDMDSKTKASVTEEQFNNTQTKYWFMFADEEKYIEK